MRKMIATIIAVTCILTFVGCTQNAHETNNGEDVTCADTTAGVVQKEMQDASQWGVTMSVEPIVNTTKMLLTISHDSQLGTPTGYLETGSAYALEIYYEDEWISFGEYMQQVMMYDYADPEVEDWTMEGCLIEPDSKVEFTIAPEDLFGSLPSGRYRIVKQIVDLTDSKEQNTLPAYAEFSLTA